MLHCPGIISNVVCVEGVQSGELAEGSGVCMPAMLMSSAQVFVLIFDCAQQTAVGLTFDDGF